MAIFLYSCKKMLLGQSKDIADTAAFADLMRTC